MSANDLLAVRARINLELHAAHVRAELGDEDAAPCADGLRSAAMIVDELLLVRYRPWFECQTCCYDTNSGPKATIHESETGHAMRIEDWTEQCT
jgi:hypothetical protein